MTKTKTGITFTKYSLSAEYFSKNSIFNEKVLIRTPDKDSNVYYYFENHERMKKNYTWNNIRVTEGYGLVYIDTNNTDPEKIKAIMLEEVDFLRRAITDNYDNTMLHFSKLESLLKEDETEVTDVQG